MKSLLGQRLRKAIGPLGAVADSSWQMTGAYGERYEPESRADFVDAYTDRVWSRRCVDLIATSATQVEMQVRPSGTQDWVSEHALIDLLERPNPRDPATMFFEWTIKWAEMVGEWYWEIVPSVTGTIAELFPLQAQFVRVKPGGGGRISGFVYDPMQKGYDPQHFAALEQMPGAVPPMVGQGPEGREVPVVLAGRYASPKDDYYGMSPLRAAKDDIISEYYGVRYDHRFFRNSARPDIVIGFKGKLDETQRKANRAEWDEFKGVDRAHRAAVLDGDPMVKELSANPKDVEYLQGRRLSREGQCAAFGVPPVLVGDLTRATYSNFREAEKIFWKITMLPKLEFFSSWATYTLVPFYPDIEELRFEVSEVAALQEAEGWRSERIRNEVSEGLLTPNEGRELLDRETVTEAGADSLWMPTRSRPIDAPGVPPPGGVQPAGIPENPTLPAPADEPIGEGAGNAGGNGSVPKSAELQRKEQRERWLRNAHQAKQRFAARATTELSSHFRGQEERVIALIEGQEKSAELERLLREYGWEADAAELHKIVDAMVEGLSVKAFAITEQAVDQPAGEGLLGQVLRDVGNRPDGISGVSARVRDDVLEQVRVGIQHGLTYRQIAQGGTFASATQGAEEVTLKGVRGVYGEYKSWQAERIARTEAGHTFNRASAALMRQAGINEVDIEDGDGFDDACAEANGSRWTVTEYEDNPLEHPNCTRIGLPVVEVPAAVGG